MPTDIRKAISASRSRAQRTANKIDKKLTGFSTEEIAEKLKVSKILDQTLFRVEKDYQKSLKNLIISPQITPERRARITEEYTENMKLDIKGWLDEEVISLRKRMEMHVFSGARHEDMVATIQRRYEVSESKAKFLARQETKLLMGKYKEIRYQDAGVNSYKWKCVTGNALHPVRPAHKALDGTIQYWNKPPIVSEPRQKVRRANAGCDFNCRCQAIPIVKF